MRLRGLPPRVRAPVRRATTAAAVIATSAVLLAASEPLPASANITTVGSCVDGGGLTWRSKVVWGGNYRSKLTGADHVSVSLAGWTTSGRRVPTDSEVKTYSNGLLIQVLRRSSTPDYRNGTRYDSRNPRNPASAPGRTKIQVSVGKDHDGKPKCSVTHTQPGHPTVEPSAAQRLLGPSRSGLPWHSGAWVGERFNSDGIAGFGRWRGRPADVVTTYSARGSYQEIMTDTWPITTWQGFPGRLSYGLAMLPDDGSGSFTSISAGAQDSVWRKVAWDLARHGRGNSIVRIGWENNLPDWRWQVTAASAPQFKTAFQRIVTVMRSEAPGLRFDFTVNCGSGLSGSSDRLAPLTAVYPGDDVVDLVGCDTYDWWNTHATSAATWGRVLHPAEGPGLADVAAFAKAHGKGASFPEWGLSRRVGGNNAGGDNSFYISAMFDFLAANSQVVAYECYFDEPSSYIANSLWGYGQNPKAAAMYARLW